MRFHQTESGQVPKIFQNLSPLEQGSSLIFLIDNKNTCKSVRESVSERRMLLLPPVKPSDFVGLESGLESGPKSK
jgi:hypothetical protein